MEQAYVTINGVDYLLDDMNKEQLKLAEQLIRVDMQVNDLMQDVEILKAAGQNIADRLAAIIE